MLAVDDEVRDWLRRARDDRLAAGLVVPHGLFDLACWLSQQCAEKALKGLLVAAGVRPEKTHALDVTLRQLAEAGIVLPTLAMPAAKLTPLAVAVRYPGIGHMTELAALSAMSEADVVLVEVEQQFRLRAGVADLTQAK
ncbi:MAG: HEPN domain-containing protein [Deltaproteobacteria bacterium]|nr:HEPN domain-containing protein [Deltaproteobacteria bacterium]